MKKQKEIMRRIQPFIGTDLIKILICSSSCEKEGIQLAIQQEIIISGVSVNQFIHVDSSHIDSVIFCSAEIFHKEISNRIEMIQGKAFLFLDEIQGVYGWEKCVNSFRVEFDCDIYIISSDINLLSGELATYLSGRYVKFDIDL